MADHLEKSLLKRGNLGYQFHDLALEIVEIAGSLHDFSGSMGWGGATEVGLSRSSFGNRRMKKAKRACLAPIRDATWKKGVLGYVDRVVEKVIYRRTERISG